MPEIDDVHHALRELLVHVVDADADAISPDARLSELGVDSLAIIEICEALGARFDVFIPDARVDAMKTVADIANATVAAGSDTAPGAPAILAEATAPAEPSLGSEEPPQATADQINDPASNFADLPPEEFERRKRRALVLIGWFVAVGVGLGLIIGVGGATALRALGLKELEPVPESSPSLPIASPTASPSASPKPSPTVSQTPEPEAETTLVANPKKVRPNQRITLSGEIGEAEPGARLQVQRHEGGKWADFPVQATLDASREFDMQVATARTGKWKFRIAVPGTDISTPAVTVEIAN